MTKFKGTPLFGQDSSPQNTSNILGLIGTGVFWLIFLICSIVVKPGQKSPKYKEVQIVLSSTPVKEKSEESPAPAQAAPAPSNQESPLEQEESPAPARQEIAKAEPVETAKPVKTAKPVEKPASAKKAESKPAPAKTKTVEKAAEPTIYKSVEELMAEQMNTKKASSSSDYDPWAAMEDDFEETSSQTSSQTGGLVSNNVPAFEGTAAQTVTKQAAENSASSSSSAEKKQTASSGTTKALSNIKNQSYAGGNASNGVEAATNVKTSNSGSGKVELVMSNGSSRALLDPASPVINLSDAAAMTIDGSRTVTIKFRVVEVGNVPRAEITITPASILSEIVRNEIIDQVSKWRFEAADYSATAEFEYKIVKW